MQLDGSGSVDPDGSQVFYFWSLTTVPSGSSAVISDAAIVNPTFVADKAGTIRPSADSRGWNAGQCTRYGADHDDQSFTYRTG